jgi:hypothetical protein
MSVGDESASNVRARLVYTERVWGGWAGSQASAHSLTPKPPRFCVGRIMKNTMKSIWVRLP